VRESSRTPGARDNIRILRPYGNPVARREIVCALVERPYVTHRDLYAGPLTTPDRV